jgi:hypothetical protein
MLLATSQTTETFDFLTGPRFDTTAALPAEARRAMALLSDRRPPRHDPRGAARQTYHVQARLAWGSAIDTTVYTRDVNAWSVGFIGTVPLPVGSKVSLRLLMPDGRRATATARVRRSRSLSTGAWFETHAEFCLPQYPFDCLRAGIDRRSPGRHVRGLRCVSSC